MLEVIETGLSRPRDRMVQERLPGLLTIESEEPAA